MPARLHTRLLHSITAQITGIVVVSVILGMGLSVAALMYFSDDRMHRLNNMLLAGQVASLAQLARQAESLEDAQAIVAAARRAGFEVNLQRTQELNLGEGAVHRRAMRLHGSERWLYDSGSYSDSDGEAPTLRIRRPSPEAGSEERIVHATHETLGTRYMAVHIDGDTMLTFGIPERPPLWRLIWPPTSLALAIGLVIVLLLSLYAVRWIVAPLSAIANAADSFGRSTDDGKRLARKGPREIVRVAHAIDDMRTRIRALLDERTRMLAAISHDLRTPLTRLRLRVERMGGDRELRDGMLHEIGQVSRMLDETLHYLRHDGRAETASRIDLPSLLQTICSDFADVGHSVVYEGPGRLAWECRPAALRRAVSNVVDNAVKHGASVIVALRRRDDGAVEIDISDDGPGLPVELRERVLEPFFKADDARSATNDGFGLGLSIARDVAHNHGGHMRLLERQPHGLIVRITLPAAGSFTGQHAAATPAAGILPARSPSTAGNRG